MCDCQITDYGAVADAVTLNTAAIQRANVSFIWIPVPRAVMAVIETIWPREWIERINVVCRVESGARPDVLLSERLIVYRKPDWAWRRSRA